MSPGVAARQPCDLVQVLLFQLSPVCHMQLQSEDTKFLVWSSVGSLNFPMWIVLRNSLLDLILYFRPSVTGRRYIICVCSKVAFLCGMVSFTTGLTMSVDSSKFSVSLIFCVVRFGIVGTLIVLVGACLTTVINFVVIVGTICFLLVLVFLSFELTALVSIVTWFFAVVASWFDFSWVLLCGLLHHSNYLQLICSFQIIQFQFPFMLWHKLFVSAILQLRLIIRILQVGRHFSWYESFNDYLSGNSECTCR